MSIIFKYDIIYLYTGKIKYKKPITSYSRVFGTSYWLLKFMKNTPTLNQTPFDKETFQKKSFNPRIPIWLIIIIVIIALAVVGFVVYKECVKSHREAPPSFVVEQDALPTEVHSYVGKIVKITNDRLVIQADAQKNYLLKNTLLTVKFNQTTEFVNLIIPKQLTGDAEKDKIKQEIISAEDIKINDTIVVSSSENIKNKILFTAERVEVQFIK